MRSTRILVVSALLITFASNLPAPIEGDCSNQQGLRCFDSCTQNGCVLIVTPDPPTDNHNFCYVINGSNCMGGTFHRCCE